LASSDKATISTDFSSKGQWDDVVMMPPKMLKSEIWGGEPTQVKTDPLQGNWAVHEQKLYPQIWRETEEHLSRSKQIVFIGYSFPAADISVFGLLRRSFANAKETYGQHPDVVIVDPNAAILALRLSQSFQIKVLLEKQFLSLKSYVLARKRE
jgi:hypothetical protein